MTNTCKKKREILFLRIPHIFSTGSLIIQFPLGFLSFFFRKIHTIVQINIPWYKSSLVPFTRPFLMLFSLPRFMIVCAMSLCSISFLCLRRICAKTRFECFGVNSVVLCHFLRIFPEIKYLKVQLQGL